MIALGASVKYVREGDTAPQGESWAGDAGVAIALFDIFAIGASVQNLGGDLSTGADLPHRTRVGLTMNFVDPQGTARLCTTLEGQWPEGEASVVVAGAEGGQPEPAAADPVACGSAAALMGWATCRDSL